MIDINSKRNKAWIVALSFLLILLTSGCNRKKIAFDPAKGSHIIILGNTFAERMQHYGYFESLLYKSFPDRDLVVRNMGWSADEPNLQPRPLNFGDVHEHLADQKADIIFMCFGLNESFKGKDSLEAFKKHLDTFTKELQSHKYNGKSAPTLIYVSPIAHENIGGLLPDGVEQNKNLEMYANAMKELAGTNKIGFINLYEPSKKSMSNNEGDHITINGIHLNDKGYRLATNWMGDQLGLEEIKDSTGYTILNNLVKSRDQEFFFRWRAVNGEYIYGRRKKPFGVLSYPPEMKKLDKMIKSLDSLIWDISLHPANGATSQQKATAVLDESVKAVGDMNMQSNDYPATTAQFSLPPGFSVNLFASEKDFPIEKPVSMLFDARGRLWVATMPTYPQYFPGFPPRDKIIILEDTDGDGKADKHTVFADHLYLPLGFAFGNGGVYVAEEPNILFLKDTDGDDKADTKEIMLHGFGSEDSHHATHAFSYGQDGALYFHEGVFLNSQVETPYGPVRSTNGATFRWEPRTGKLSHYIAYKYNNPWGNVFDKWGMHLIGDASDGKNYYATPMTGKIDYPFQHPEINMFTTTRVRPTAGVEIVSSRHFPDSTQGNFLVNNTIGFQGIKQHKIIYTGSGLTTIETTALLQSSDPNFRPVDLKFAPDGSLYVVDWFNPLIGHMQFSLRDPMRDKAHGRIWRITYTGRPLLKPVNLSQQSIPQLLDNLKEYEDRFRYRSREQLRIKDVKQVTPALEKWLAALDKTNAGYEHNMLEALWIYQDFDVVKEDLLKTLLSANDFRARAAATRVLYYWRERISNSLDLMAAQANDDSARVRIEAAVALSYFNSEKAVAATLAVLNHPMDYYLDYTCRETLKYLKPLWLNSMKQDVQSLTGKPEQIEFLLNLATAEELKAMKKGEAVLTALLTRDGVSKEDRKAALKELATKLNTSEQQVLVNLLSKNKYVTSLSRKDLSAILIAGNKVDILNNRANITHLLDTTLEKDSRLAGFATLINADGSDEAVYKMATGNVTSMTDYLDALKLLPDSLLRVSLYNRVKALITTMPVNLRQSPRAAAVQNAAIGALAQVPANDRERIQYIAGFIRNGGAHSEAAANALSSMPDRVLTNGDLMPIVEKILVTVKLTPPPERKSTAFNNMLKAGKKLAKLLPVTEGMKATLILESTGTFEVQVSTLPSKMLFDKQVIVIPAGRPVVITFNNPDEMPHNFVIIKGGAIEKVGKAADAMGAGKEGFEKNFVPDLPEVLYSTPLVNPGDDATLEFTAPAVAGEYAFICSFPGHWQMMRGVLKVVKL